MRTFVIFIHFMFCTIYISAQTSYYTQTKTFTENGYSYQCDVRESGIVTLYKKGDKWVHTNTLTYRNTGEIYVMDNDTPDIIEPVDDNFINTCKSIINNAFSREQKQRVKGAKFIFSLYINPNTGKINEVAFEFYKIGTYATIPVSVYRYMEVNMKEKLSFKPTEEGKKLNYILYWMEVEPQ